MGDLNERLDGIGRDCGYDGWDSYGARAVTPVAVAATKRLLASAQVSPTNSGGINLYWADEAVSIEVGADGRVAEFYVAVNDANGWLATTPATEQTGDET